MSFLSLISRLIRQLGIFYNLGKLIFVSNHLSGTSLAHDKWSFTIWSGSLHRFVNFQVSWSSMTTWANVLEKYNFPNIICHVYVPTSVRFAPAISRVSVSIVCASYLKQDLHGHNGWLFDRMWALIWWEIRFHIFEWLELIHQEMYDEVDSSLFEGCKHHNKVYPR